MIVVGEVQRVKGNSYFNKNNTTKYAWNRVVRVRVVNRPMMDYLFIVI